MNPVPEMTQKKRKIKKRETVTVRSALTLVVFMAISVHLMVAGRALAQSGPVQTIMTVPSTVVALDPPEVFDPDTLFEKINGQAALYLSAGFVRLTSQWFAEAENRDSMFEVYVYDMGDGLNAFSVFSAQRREDAQKVDLAQFAYRTKNSLYLAHGPYYVEMIPAAPSETVLQKITVLAENFIRETPVDAISMDVFGLFPAGNLDRDGISLIAENAFGFNGLDRVFTAVYTIGGNTVTAFVSKRKTAQEAADLSQRFYAYFLAFGGKDTTPGVAIENAKMVEIMDTFDIMFSIDAYLAGVHEAPTKELAKELAESLYKTLRGVPASGNR